MYAAIIDYKPGLSKLDQTLFFKKTLKNCQSEIIENDISIVSIVYFSQKVYTI